MRTFSALREHCNYPEIIDMSFPMTIARRKSCGDGTDFHSLVEAWVKGKPFGPPSSKDVQDWFRTMQTIWSPPVDCTCEVAIGITEDERAVEVDEPEPHVYVPRREGDTLLTAGRLDLLWREDQGSTGVVCDIKTGRTYLGDPWSIPQLVAQAVAVALRSRGSEMTDIKLGVYYARPAIFEFPPMRPIEEVIDMLPMVRRWATAENNPRPGAHCLACWSATNCPENPMKRAGQ